MEVPGLDAPLDPARPLLVQRRHARLNPTYCKPLVTRAPIRWRPGLHFSDATTAFDDLLLLHTRYADRAQAVVRLAQLRTVDVAYQAAFSFPLEGRRQRHHRRAGRRRPRPLARPHPRRRPTLGGAAASTPGRQSPLTPSTSSARSGTSTPAGSSFQPTCDVKAANAPLRLPVRAGLAPRHAPT